MVMMIYSSNIIGRVWRFNCGHACAFGRVDEAVSGGKPLAGKGVVGLLSWHGSHFWVCITFCKVRHGDSVNKTIPPNPWSRRTINNLGKWPNQWKSQIWRYRMLSSCWKSRILYTTKWHYVEVSTLWETESNFDSNYLISRNLSQTILIFEL